MNVCIQIVQQVEGLVENGTENLYLSSDLTYFKVSYLDYPFDTWQLVCNKVSSLSCFNMLVINNIRYANNGTYLKGTHPLNKNY